MAPSSPARIAASRANARNHATGPKSALGKERARLNSLRHGMAGRGVGLLPEDQELVDAKAALWAEELGAEGDLERTLVAEAATAYARMRRADTTEADRAARRAQAARGRQLAAASRGSIAAEEADDWPDLIAAVEATGKFKLAQLTRARELSGVVEADPRVQQLRDLDARIQRRDRTALPDLVAWMRRQAERAAVAAEEGRGDLAAVEAAPRRDAWLDKSRTGELLRRYRGAAGREFHRALARLERVRKLAAPTLGDEADDDPRNEARSAEEMQTYAPGPAIPEAEPSGPPASNEGRQEGDAAEPATSDDRPTGTPADPRNEARSCGESTTYVPSFAAIGPVVGVALPGDRQSPDLPAGPGGPGGRLCGAV